MALVKRGDTYWLDVQINGKRVRESLKTGDKKEASRLHDIRRGELWRIGVGGEKPRKTLVDAFVRWLREKDSKRSLSDDQDKVRYFSQRLGHLQLSDLTRDAIEDALPADVKPATRNRYRALIRSVLLAAEREWEWIDRAPILRTETEDNIKEAYISREQAERLLAELPAHWRPLVRFALLTGLRRGNLLGLDWSQINLDAGTVTIAASDFKTGRRVVLPLNSAAKAVLSNLEGIREGRVFHVHAITNRTWHAACRRAGLPAGFRFHDLRHSFASWHAAAGTDMLTLQHLGGWSSPAMLKRYVAFAPEHLQRAAESISL